MPRLSLPADELLQHRQARIAQFLRPLRNGMQVPVQWVPGQFELGRVVAAGMLGGADNHYDNYKFPTFAPRIFCKYFELWRPVSDRRYYMYRGYLTVLRMNFEHRLEQIICLHCDPDDDAAQPMRSYKQGPHLHICRAETPMPDCHFPLNYSHLQKVLFSVNSLSKAISNATKIIANEVIKSYV